ncbi:MAG: phosphoribosyl-AMP cyclohydrolase [Verrucomicrobiales bacterium]|nr:phosphoribosyl-AMP cyclohydrolase [Verrucomicrobiales bacterium]MBP9224102.1 phosphoribosyl-AMP cyclohydrolase [Verrucomicrobiales bacterium]
MSSSTEIAFGSRDDRKALEIGLTFSPKFDESGLIVAIAQDADTNEVLMVAYMNEEALRETLSLGEAVYFSRSRQQLWHKGATSGHTQIVEKILTDCDQDALVLKVRQQGPGCCHAGYRSCFYRNIQAPGNPVPLGQEIENQSYNPDEVYK